MSRRSRDERDRAATRPLDSTFRNAVRTLVVLGVALVAMVLPGSAFGAAKGLETEITWGVDSATQSQDAAGMRDLGVSWTRLTLNWHDAEPSKGSYSSSYLSAFDNALNLTRSSGVTPIVDVYGSPQWASSTTNPDAPPQNNADFANFVHAMAARYAGRVAGWEIWNEENLGRFWGQSPNPGVYADMLKQSYSAVKSADSGAKVIFGGMSESDWPFLQKAYDAMPDLNNYFDVMAIHPYAPQSSPDLVTFTGDGHIAPDSFAGYREVRRVMLEHGADRPLYFTEMGWSTTSQQGMGVSQQQQADYTALAWKCMQMDSYVQVGFLYELRNNWWSGDADNWEDQLGLTTTGWSHKPAYDAYRGVDPNAGGCTYHDSNGDVLGPGTTLLPKQQAQAPAAAAPTTKSSAKAPTILLKVKSAPGAHSSGSSRRLKTGVRFKVFGKVLAAKGGKLVLTFQHRGKHRHWNKMFRRTLKVTATGNFSSKKMKALKKGAWRVQGQYKPTPKPAKSRFVYFKA
jgi:hypothetical protein